jgi:hypothetical protein
VQRARVVAGRAVPTAQVRLQRRPPHARRLLREECQERLDLERLADLRIPVTAAARSRFSAALDGPSGSSSGYRSFS